MMVVTRQVVGRAVAVVATMLARAVAMFPVTATANCKYEDVNESTGRKTCACSMPPVLPILRPDC